ncbi:MAG: hypothetical protein JRD69_10195 [Deltaproteobacteria bacterium]|nr:hypothetical protein [Deltaproteobacteria bacterium]
MTKDTEVKMVLPCKCPHCHMDIVVKLDMPSPVVTDVLKPDDVDEDIKKLIKEEDDITKEPKTK